MHTLFSKSARFVAVGLMMGLTLAVAGCGKSGSAASAVSANDMSEGVPTAVVSMPCRLLFERQDVAYRRQVLGDEETARVRARTAGHPAHRS